MTSSSSSKKSDRVAILYGKKGIIRVDESFKVLQNAIETGWNGSRVFTHGLAVRYEDGAHHLSIPPEALGATELLIYLVGDHAPSGLLFDATIELPPSIVLTSLVDAFPKLTSLAVVVNSLQRHKPTEHLIAALAKATKGISLPLTVLTPDAQHYSLDRSSEQYRRSEGIGYADEREALDEFANYFAAEFPVIPSSLSLHQALLLKFRPAGKSSGGLLQVLVDQHALYPSIPALIVAQSPPFVIWSSDWCAGQEHEPEQQDGLQALRHPLTLTRTFSLEWKRPKSPETAPDEEYVRDLRTMLDGLHVGVNTNQGPAAHVLSRLWDMRDEELRASLVSFLALEMDTARSKSYIFGCLARGHSNQLCPFHVRGSEILRSNLEMFLNSVSASSPSSSSSKNSLAISDSPFETLAEGVTDPKPLSIERESPNSSGSASPSSSEGRQSSHRSSFDSDGPPQLLDLSTLIAENAALKARIEELEAAKAIESAPGLPDE